MTNLHKQEGVAEAIKSSFEAFEAELNGQSKQPIHQLRKAALSQLDQIGLPGPRHEEYKYTQIGKRLQKQFDLQAATAGKELSSFTAADYHIEGLEANQVVFVNGHYRADLSQIISKNLICIELSAAYAEYQEEIDAHLGQYADQETDGFTAYNTAFTRQGLFIKAAKGKVIEEPIVIWYFSDSKDVKPVIQPRNLVIVEEAAQLRFAELYKSGTDTTSFTNVVTEVVVQKDAVVDYYKLLHEGANAYHIANAHFEQVETSTVNTVTIALSGAMVRNNLNIVLDAEHCEANMYGLYLLGDKTHVDNHTTVDHKKPNSYSNELYKGVMDDRSTGVFNGKIFVRQDAQKTNAFQSNRNILLSDDASVNTKPQLEIWADDVKCSHGATTGRLDDEQLFYMRARGVDAVTARAILLYAFAKDVLENIKVEPLRQYIDNIVSQRLLQND